MADETIVAEIVAVYDTAAHASRAVQDLEAAGVPSSAMSTHAGNAGATGSSTTASAPHEQGFRASLFGGELEYKHDTTVYDRSLASGSTVVTVRPPEQHLAQVMDILERQNPVDMDERAASYGLSTGATTVATTPAPLATTASRATAAPVAAFEQTSALQGRREDVVKLAEEQLSVGKRVVNRGTTRIRQFVVEKPVEEVVTLHSEHVFVERRPAMGDAKVTDSNFSDRTIEVNETAEEAVVAKKSRVTEEVVVNKAAMDRVEIVRATVRSEDVEVSRDGTTTATPTPATQSRN